jgi:hypothetical protein
MEARPLIGRRSFESQASNREAVEVIEVSNGDFTDKR